MVVAESEWIWFISGSFSFTLFSLIMYKSSTKKIFSQTLPHALTHTVSLQVKVIPLPVFYMMRHDLERVAVQQHHQHLYTGTALSTLRLKYDCLSFIIRGFLNIVCDV